MTKGAALVVLTLATVAHAPAAFVGFSSANGGFEARGHGLGVRVRADGSREVVAHASWRLSAPVLSRGGQQTSCRGTNRVERGTLWLEGEGCRESLALESGSLVHALHLPHAPPGDGPLVMTLETEGGALTASRGGAHALSPRGAFRYGDAFWVDARGRRTPLEVQVRGGALVVSVSEAVLARTEWPAVLDPTVSAEFPVDVPMATESPSHQNNPAIAWNGTVYLAVWADRRRGEYDVYAARVSASGALLDARSIQVSAAPFEQANPRVTAVGSTFFVTWADIRNGGWDVYGARVDGSGLVLDPNGIALSTAGGNQTRPDVASNGSGVLVAWTDTRNGNDDVYGVRVSSAGQLVDATPLAIAVGPNAQRSPAVAGNANGYAVAFSDSRSGNPNVSATRVSSAGMVLDGTGLPLGASAQAEELPALATNGTDFFAAWQVASPTVTDVVGARFTGAGVVTDASPIAISTAAASQGAPQVAFVMNQYAVVWEDARSGAMQIYGGRVNTGGTALDANGVLLASRPVQTYEPVLAFGGANGLLVWTDLGGDYDIAGRTVPLVLTGLGPPAIVSGSGATSYAPAVADTGAVSLVVWERVLGKVSHVVAVRVAHDGTVLDPTPLDVTPSATGGAADPAVAAVGADFLVVWTDFRNATDEVYAARVSGAGALLDATAVQLSTGAGSKGHASVASDGTRALVVHEQGTDLATVVVTGSTPGARQTITAAGAQRWPRVAFGGAEHLVAWEDTRSDTGDVYVARVSAAGSVLEPTGVALAATSGAQTRPRVARSRDGWLLGWTDASGADAEVVLGQVAPGGGALGPTVRMTAAEDQLVRSVLATDEAWLAVAETYAVDLVGGDVGLAVFPTDGGPSTWLELSATPHPEFDPALTGVGDGGALVVYTRFDPVEARTFRTFARRVLAGEVSAGGGAGGGGGSAGGGGGGGAAGGGSGGGASGGGSGAGGGGGEALGPIDLTVACGCSSAPWPALLLLAAWCQTLRRRLRPSLRGQTDGQEAETERPDRQDEAVSGD